MATFLVCTHCGKTLEIERSDQLPKDWQLTKEGLACPSCPASDVLDEEVVYPAASNEDPEFDDTFGGDFCEICSGSCQGHNP